MTILNLRKLLRVCPALNIYRNVAASYFKRIVYSTNYPTFEIYFMNFYVFQNIFKFIFYIKNQLNAEHQFLSKALQTILAFILRYSYILSYL